MSSARHDSLCQRIDQMADWKAAALCAVSASKVTPIISRLGLPGTWHLVEECVKFVWESVGQTPNAEEALGFIESLQSTPEWNVEDNSFLPFAVTQALDFVKLSLSSFATPASAKKNAAGALDLLAGLASGYDFAAKKFPALAMAKGSDVKLQTSEELSQDHLLSMLEKADGPSSQTLSDLRTEADRVARLIKIFLPIYCYEYANC